MTNGMLAYRINARATQFLPILKTRLIQYDFLPSKTVGCRVMPVWKGPRPCPPSVRWRSNDRLSDWGPPTYESIRIEQVFYTEAQIRRRHHLDHLRRRDLDKLQPASDYLYQSESVITDFFARSACRPGCCLIGVKAHRLRIPC